jgi:hypothetical protein
MAANKKDTTTLGPAKGTVSAMAKKIPVPKVLPTPMSINCQSVKLRGSAVSVEAFESVLVVDGVGKVFL